ncbi:transcription termination factor NusA [Miniphocaeibacter massiliensis]|uniref:transcription termination factor NusA n=1 Tax=Miniphocaeibacter massiliensis TaxID=2041841 RepID=UPI000C085EC9|nr:transcription termination factor NusA [Miniphocaeibacter massiliensis]
MNQEFMNALMDIEKTKGVSSDVIIDALEKALVKSYEKNFDDNANVTVSINRNNGEAKIFAIKKVVENIEDKITEISVEEAENINSNLNIGDEVTIEVTPKNFGRIAAQTARNIVIQKIKDAEREIIYNEFISREKELITGIVQRIDHGMIYVDLGKIEGIVPPSEQIINETYRINDRFKFYIKEVKNTTKGAQVILSRTDIGLVRRLLELEVPEINDGIVEIFSISREAGSRTKLAVFTKDENIDPVGACVGFKGTRVKSIVDELNGEKLDIIIWNKDVKIFLANSLSPAEVVKVFVNEKEKVARIIVESSQLSLAIGKEGQNARLAAKLTNWKIDIKGTEQYLEGIKSGDIVAEFPEEEEYINSLIDLN